MSDLTYCRTESFSNFSTTENKISVEVVNAKEVYNSQCSEIEITFKVIDGIHKGEIIRGAWESHKGVKND